LNGDIQAESKDPVHRQSRAILPLASLEKGFPWLFAGEELLLPTGAAALCRCPRTVPWEGDEAG